MAASMSVKPRSSLGECLLSLLLLGHPQFRILSSGPELG